MACKGSSKHSASKQEWSHEDLDKALSLVTEENVSIRTAALSYGIPKSTLHDHCSGKVKGSKVRRGNSECGAISYFLTIMFPAFRKIE